MEDNKRKQLEAQLRQLINAANRETPRAELNTAESTVEIPEKTQVIRRRKGNPDRHILVGKQSQSEPALQQ